MLYKALKCNQAAKTSGMKGLISVVMDLKQCRNEIDKINKDMLELFIRRMKISDDVARYKAENGMPILNRAREREILSEMTELAGEEFENYAKVFYSVIMDLSRSRQSTLIKHGSSVTEKVKTALASSPKIFPKRANVACQGTEGAYSQIAADKLFGLEKIHYFGTFEEVFTAVRDGVCEYGVLPIENSTYGTVVEVYDLMKRFDFSIVRSAKIKVRHALLAPKGVKFEDIKQVYSHPQALAQCADFFRENPQIEAIPCTNTALAAKRVSEDKSGSSAAIASQSCGELYGLDILRSEVQNNSNNATRFICISGKPTVFPGADKISLLLTLPHTPGSLYNTLAKFTAEGLNLTKLENRPIEGSDFEAQFYFDLEASPYDDRVLTLLDAVASECESFSFLGAYREV